MKSVCVRAHMMCLCACRSISLFPFALHSTRSVIFIHPHNRCRIVICFNIYSFSVCVCMFARHAKNYTQNSWITNFRQIFHSHMYLQCTDIVYSPEVALVHMRTLYTCMQQPAFIQPSIHPFPSPRWLGWTDLLPSSLPNDTHHSWCVKK